MESDNAKIKAALIESKRILEFYIKNYNDVDDLNENPEIVKHFIRALLLKCECDDYNGFDCGCSQRAFLCDEALKEIELLNKPANGKSKID